MSVRQEDLVPGQLRQFSDDIYLPSRVRRKMALVVTHEPGGLCKVLIDGCVIPYSWHFVLQNTTLTDHNAVICVPQIKSD